MFECLWNWGNEPFGRILTRVRSPFICIVNFCFVAFSIVSAECILHLQRSPYAFCMCKLHTNHSDYFFCFGKFNAPFIWLSHLALPFGRFGHVEIDVFCTAPHNRSQRNEYKIEWIPVGMTTMSTAMIETIKFEHKKQKTMCKPTMRPFVRCVYSQNFSLTFWSKYAETKTVQMKTEFRNSTIKKLYETASNRGRPYVFQLFFHSFIPMRIFFALKKETKKGKIIIINTNK